MNTCSGRLLTPSLRPPRSPCHPFRRTGRGRPRWKPVRRAKKNDQRGPRPDLVPTLGAAGRGTRSRRSPSEGRSPPSMGHEDKPSKGGEEGVFMPAHSPNERTNEEEETRRGWREGPQKGGFEFLSHSYANYEPAPPPPPSSRSGSGPPPVLPSSSGETSKPFALFPAQHVPSFTLARRSLSTFLRHGMPAFFPSLRKVNSWFEKVKAFLLLFFSSRTSQ